MTFVVLLLNIYKICAIREDVKFVYNCNVGVVSTFLYLNRFWCISIARMVCILENEYYM